MTLDKRLTNCAVIGAAGKMGRGIVLVLLQEMISTDLKLKRPLSKLICIDRSCEGLTSLREYLDSQMLKFAERNISSLRAWYMDKAELIDNSEIIEYFLKQCRSLISTDSSYSFLGETRMIFEAVFENLEIKNSVYHELLKVCPKDCLFFSNTSSIPISELNTQNDLKGRLIGFHFYNPPAVQKLVEVITTKENKTEDITLAMDLIVRLKKLAIPSNDIAGFIGNGHFIREGLFYLRQLEQLPFSNSASLLFVNDIIQKLMFRPMGMFQLIDYVGIDVFSMICSTMQKYIDEDFESDILTALIKEKVCGGQYGDGSQKDGFFKYVKGQISAVYDWQAKSYKAVEDVRKELSAVKLPELSENWKSLSRSRNFEYISNAFTKYLKSDQLTQKSAVAYLRNSRKIARDLVQNGVAEYMQNVNDVMVSGFYHLYGPDSKITACIPETEDE